MYKLGQTPILTIEGHRERNFAGWIRFETTNSTLASILDILVIFIVFVAALSVMRIKIFKMSQTPYVGIRSKIVSVDTFWDNKFISGIHFGNF